MAGVSGQGRRFDMTTALNTAMEVFWQWGYEGASLAILTAAMEIRPPSLYAAFGSKESLFFTVVDHYNATHGSFLAEAMAEETSGTRLARRVLHEAAAHYASSGHPGGCLVISAAVTVTPGNRHVADRLAGMRNENLAAFEQAFQRDVDSGELPPHADPHRLARFVAATLQGMSQQARDGARVEELQAVAATALTAI
ncbi:TetR/AcrR family transcriptional regulator [Jiangella alkaliphila]|uniref:DNA-binding transcriptional regulator, AcrR family n=1 Tax=Jiangella alkaliphila TaxID=419479 RepID=A0A1H2IRJ3_9ACTN|nr:TetR/AcrR family transcriptional regulator [Jiangella alkaliphila]SDU46506.1 DNA-binding transcriptional regulator, AcrR family [Jiangella alkaliphila]